MPRDVSGNYTLPIGNPVVSGTIIDVAWANPTMADVAVQLNNVLTRDGLLGATANISMGNNRLTAMANAVSAQDATTLTQVTAAITAAVNAAMPSGTLLDYAGSVVPTGFLLCDGSAVSRTTYATLFAAIGTTWGVGDGATTFNLPDLRRRTTMGSGGTAVAGPANTLGATGGVEQITVAGANLPAHVHSFAATSTAMSANATHTHTDSGHFHTTSQQGIFGGGGLTFTGGGFNVTNPNTGTSFANLNTVNIDHNHSVSGNTGNGPGAGTAITTISPTAIVTKIIKT